MKIYGNNFSGPSNKVRFVANALQLDYEYQQIQLMQGEQRSDWYLKLNPAGRVPLLDDDGFVLWESNAICKYLTSKKDFMFYAKTPEDQARIDPWIDFGSLHVGTAMNRVTFNRILAPRMGRPVDKQSLEDGLSFLNKFLPIIEAQLTAQPFLAGSSLTLADFNLLAILDPVEVAEVSLEPYPKLSAVRNQLMKELFYTDCHESFDAVLATLGK